MGKVYIIGPTVGLRNLNLYTFDKVAEKLRGLGYEPVVPHYLFSNDENERGGITVGDSIIRRQSALEECEVAVFIPGYEDDHFACIEGVTAKNLNLKRLRLDQLKKNTHVSTINKK